MRIGLDATPIVEECAGIGNYVKELMREMIIALPNEQFYLYVYKKISCHHEWDSYANVTIRSVPFFSCSHTLWLQLSLPFFLKKDQIDLFWGSCQAVPLFHSKKMQTLLNLHDFVYLLDPLSMPYLLQKSFDLLMPYMVKKSDYLLANSQGTATRLELFYNRKVDGFLFPPIKPIFCQKQKTELMPYLSSQNLSYKNYLLVVGTIEPRKKLSTVLSCYENCLKTDPVSSLLPLVIIGGGGWKNHSLHAQLDCMSRSYPTHVKVLGYVPDENLVLLMNGARALLMLSAYEGYGMPLAESRSCGTPVVATDIPEMRQAAEGDGVFLSSSEIEKEIPPYFLSSFFPSPCQPVSYPSSRQKIASFLEILQKIASREKP